MERQRIIYSILFISVIILMCGCQSAPKDVKEKSKKYQQAVDVKETDIKYVSIEHILDNQEEILGKTYQNLEFKKTVHLEQPDSVSVLSLTITNPFTTKEKFADLCSVFFDTDSYRQEITRMDDLPEFPYEGVFAFNYESDESENNATVSDSGFLACHKKNAQVFTDCREAVCHVDWNEDMSAVYNLDGEDVSIKEAVDYVNEWCNKNWVLLEPEYNYQVKTVYVCKANNKRYYYYFDVCKFYKGMPFDDIDFNIDNDNIYNRNSLDVVMEHKNELSFFRNNDNSYDIVNDEINNDKLIGLEQAVLLVEQKMSGGQKFRIADIDLKYVLRSDMTEEEVINTHTSFVAPGSPFTARPVWSFILDYQATKDEEESHPWPRKFINVDMITGEILYCDIIE